MNREKLNKAALANTEAAADLIADPQHLAVNSFIQGAEWLLTQPLSERLTDAEREDIAFAYKTLARLIQETEITNPNLAEVFKGQQLLLSSIFGADLFREK